MAGNDKKTERGEEAAWIRELAGILDETGLTEIEIEKDGARLRVAKQGVALAAPAAIATPAPAAAPVSTPSPASTPSQTNHPGAVKSPMVGTAYLAPSPGAAQFVKEGGTVTEGQTVIIIEAMKTMNPIAAPRSGTVTKILVSDAQPVEFDEPLIIIE